METPQTPNPRRRRPFSAVNAHKTAAEAVTVIAHIVSFERSLLAVARIGREAADAG